MNQLESNNHSQPTRPQNAYKRLKRCTIRFFQRLGRHNTTRRQEELHSATGNSKTRGSHGQHPLDMSVSGRKGPESATTNTGTSGFRIRAQLHNASHDHLPHTTVSAKSVATNDVKQSGAFFQNAHAFKISGNPSFQNQNIGSVTTNVYGGGKDGLEKLEKFVSFDAQCDSSAQDPQRRCHPGTRENVLKRLRDWVDNPETKERVFWLYGPAGAGKSAIAQTIASSYARPTVAATFFFFRSDVNRNDGNRLFTTLAYQLACSIPIIRDHIVNSLSERPDLPRTGVETQFNELLARPFQVLSNDAAQQLAPAVHIIIDILKKCQDLAPVIIIDGVDECTDENIQRRFLKVIGDAVADDRFPLRFLIVSRPELHIEKTIRRFQTPILTIDLANLDDANRDIEKYLVEEFSRIASEQGLDSTWPGPKIIRDIVYKSSGHFILPSIIIKFVGDPDNFAETQLDIVRNMKPPTTMTPFAVLDQLFLEILKRVPDQDFLKRYLAVLTARIGVSRDYGELYKDDAVFMHVCEKELRAKLRKMLSLLRLEDRIDVHHRSFIDFLHDSSRSGQYHIPKGEIRRYLEVFVDSFVRYVSSMIEQPNHNSPHFNPRFRAMIEVFPPKINLPANEWQEVTQPVLDLQNKLLQLPNFDFIWHLLPCDECTVFHLMRELLHLRRCVGQSRNSSIQPDARKFKHAVSLITTKTDKNTDSDDLDSILMSLLAHIPEIMENWTPNEEVIKLGLAILHFDFPEVARSVRFVSDGQKLVDLLVYMIRADNALSRIHPDGMRKAVLLSLEIFARAPILPLSFGRDALFLYTWPNDTVPIQILSQTIIASRMLDRYYVVPMLGGYLVRSERIVFRGDMQKDNSSMTLTQWRTSFPISATVRQMMFELAKAIQYFHSFGVVLHREFGSDNVFWDSSRGLKIRCWCSTSRFLLDKQWKGWFSPEENIFAFGCIFYELFSGVDTQPLISSEMRRRIIAQRGSVTRMPEYARQLIRRCCTGDPGSRPTIDKIVEEMESWKIE